MVKTPKFKNQLRRLGLVGLLCAFIAALVIQTPWLIGRAVAAEATVDGSAGTAGGTRDSDSPGTVFTSDQNGYAFYRDADGSCVYSKTTDGGANWGAAVQVDAQTDCTAVSVWYDRWTPGDNSGTNIYIITADNGNATPAGSSGDLWYNRLDTSSDTRENGSSPVAFTDDEFNTLANGQPGNKPALTKGTDGDLYVGIADSGNASDVDYVMKCTGTCSTATNWTNTSGGAPGAAGDELILMPLASGNIIAISLDTGLDDIRSKVYTDSSATWDGSFANIDTAAIDNNSYENGMGAALNRLTGDIYLTYYADVGTLGGSDDDVRTAKYVSGAWQAAANSNAPADVITNTTGDITGSRVAVNENNGDVYAVYSRRTTSGTATSANVYYKLSTDGMANWGGETQVSGVTSRDYRGIRPNITSGDRLYATYWDNGGAAVYGNTVVDLTPPTYSASAYRWFANANSTDVGSTLAVQDTSATAPTQGTAFRLRLAVHVAGDGTQKNLDNLKLQFAQKSGSCDTAYSGESYADVATGSGTIRYYDNSTPADGDDLTSNANDPAHSGHTNRKQDYEEANNFTNSVLAIASGEDGLWDFALVDNSATAGTSYCFRIVKSDGTAVATPTVVPEITTAAAADPCTASGAVDKQMRHGTLWDSNTKQKMCWAS